MHPLPPQFPGSEEPSQWPCLLNRVNPFPVETDLKTPVSKPKQTKQDLT